MGFENVPSELRQAFKFFAYAIGIGVVIGVILYIWLR
jgi:hypothetical protein